MDHLFYMMLLNLPIKAKWIVLLFRQIAIVFSIVKDMSSKILDIGLRSTKNSEDESTDLDVLCELMKKIMKHELPDLIVHLRATIQQLQNK